jgi:molybdopterin adenylyltransferase
LIQGATPLFREAQPLTLRYLDRKGKAFPHIRRLSRGLVGLIMSAQIHAVVITASDACSHGEREDKSGELLVELLNEIGARIVAKEILSDDLEPLSDKLREYADRPDVNLILTTGGTGFGLRDNTPEATQRVLERQAPGLSEAMRIETLKNTPMAMISRGVSGIRSATLIVNLPGSPKGVRESFEVIKPVLNHVINLLSGDNAH